MRKGIDQYGRIVHHYSFVGDGVNSKNTALLNNSSRVRFIARKDEITGTGAMIRGGNLKNGYWQLAVHPSDWFSQVYSLAKNEHYIDYACLLAKQTPPR